MPLEGVRHVKIIPSNQYSMTHLQEESHELTGIKQRLSTSSERLKEKLYLKLLNIFEQLRTCDFQKVKKQ